MNGALDMDAAIAAAQAACDVSGALLAKAFRRQLRSDVKADNTIVTEADQGAERVMREVLTRMMPEHRVTGEEFPPEGPDSRWEWVLDPIDGTIAFACGKAQFTTLCALLEDGVPVLGVIDQPVAGERWIGARGRATTFNGAPCRASGAQTLSEARFGTTDPYLFPVADAIRFDRLRRAARVTSFGGDGYAYGLLASGHLDLIFECGLSRHDVAALVPVILGAGAAACDATGAACEGMVLPEGEKFSIIAAGSEALLAEAAGA